MTFVAGATKINLKDLKTWKHQLYNDGTFEPLTNSGRSLIWAQHLDMVELINQAYKNSSQEFVMTFPI